MISKKKTRTCFIVFTIIQDYLIKGKLINIVFLFVNIVLVQSVLNPFAEQASIKYYLPSTIQKAQLLFYDAQGKLIKAVDLEGRGDGQINIFADDLTNGIYTYALVTDGKVVDSKRMVKTK